MPSPSGDDDTYSVRDGWDRINDKTRQVDFARSQPVKEDVAPFAAIFDKGMAAEQQRKEEVCREKNVMFW